MSYFQRIPNFFDKDEACFMFISKGEFSVRTPDQFLSFNEGNGLLANCFNYFIETNEDQRKSSDEKKYRVLILVSSVTIHSI